MLSVFMLVTLLSYGALPQHESLMVYQPSMGSVLESIVGHWGSRLHPRRCRGVGARCVSGLDADVCRPWYPRKSEDMPRFLARTNKNGAPVNALVMAAGLIQLLLILLIFASNALDFMLDLTVALSLVPYLLAAAYALKLTITRDTYPTRRSAAGDMVITALATAYTLFVWFR